MAAEHLRQALRAEVALAVGPVLAPHLRWSTSQLPTLRDVLPLRSLLLTTGTDVDTLLVDTSALTLFEASDGNWGARRGQFTTLHLGFSPISLCCVYNSRVTVIFCCCNSGETLALLARHSHLGSGAAMPFFPFTYERGRDARLPNGTPPFGMRVFEHQRVSGQHTVPSSRLCPLFSVAWRE